ncbi:MAG: phosphoenolpyruvate--protein phosphotransferase [Alphaproteobacteria bacterium]|nr:phosphoenolpyruvate--protein phosphotransferase [Alphaproteobacteria bacterium]
MTAGAGATGPRVLLRRLRELMADRGDAQKRLDQTVRLIAANMVAEVCSVYLMRQGKELELFATEGLKREAVHQTRLKVGEGLIGDIAENARPLMLDDAWSHPNFVYRPETGEEIFASMLGVPINWDGRVVGVLAVQNRKKRLYTEDEAEDLQTVAMVLAEMIGSGVLVPREELKAALVPPRGPVRLSGLRLAEGLASGVAVLHEPRVEVHSLIAEDSGAERRRLHAAIEALRASVDAMLDSDDFAAGGEHREVLEAYRLFAHDRGWLARMEEAVGTGLTAEAAVRRVQEEQHARMQQVTDPYLRERLHDLEDLANRLLRHLMGIDQTAASGQLPEETVLLARNMGPAELLDYDRRRLKAVLLEEGSQTAHVAIIARALDIPVIGRLAGLLERVEPGDRLLVDADHAQVFARPTPDVMGAFAGAIAARAMRRAEYQKLRDRPAVTKDGVLVSLAINAGLLIDLPQLEATGADGIGLYRTELHLMVRSSLPDVDTQAEVYGKVLEAAGAKPVIFRTFDVGGDKAVPYFGGGGEENPALGWRAIRIGLDRPAMLRLQVRALIRAAAGRRLEVMFPMVSEVAEFDAAKRMLMREVKRHQATGGAPPAEIRVGTMIEVPALVWQIDALLRRVDFVSVGSNDLMQYLYAADRGNPRLADRYDSLSPGFLRLMRHLSRRCAAAKVPISVCGEMAGRPIEALALVALGITRLSMTPTTVGPVKAALLALDAASLGREIEKRLDSPLRSLRPLLEELAAKEGIPI